MSVAPRQLIDHFKVLRQLGSGGSADVYLARDTKLGRLVAIKLLRDATAEQLQEARTLAQLDHPNIVRIFAVGQSGDLPYLALEYVEGKNLRALLCAEGASSVRPMALRWMAKIAEALAHAHDHGVVHSDLKPENILLTEDGRLRLFDFGLSAPRKDGRIRGSRAYMAPELWRGEQPTAAVDVWALGVLLHELLTGHRPYDAASDIAAEVCGAEQAPLREGIDKGAVELLGRLLDKDPSRRPTAAEIVALLAHQPQLPQAPYVGLRPLQEQEAPLFFGRETEVTEALERLRQDPTLIVAGPCGVGKTSLARAGIAARLQEQQSWQLIVMRPGERPFEQLAAQLAARLAKAGRKGVGPSKAGRRTDESAARTCQDDHLYAGEEKTDWARRSGTVGPAGRAAQSARLPSGKNDAISSQSARDDLATLLQENPQILPLLLDQLAEQNQQNVLLLVDGIEELCTTSGDDGALFLEAILGAADEPGGPVRTLMTLRDDYIGALGELGDKPRRALARQLLLIERPQPTALQQIIVAPLAAFGYRFDDAALPSEMTAAVATEQHALALLAFIARAMWERRDDDARCLRRAAYEELGGIAGALARHATSVVSALPSRQLGRVRELLLRLVTTRGTRRCVRRADLLAGADDEGTEVLEQLVAGRLLVVRRDLAAAETNSPGSELEGDDVVVELAHESLIEHWDQLSRWLEQSQAHHAVTEELEQAAMLWQRRGHRDDELWSGDALKEAERAIEQRVVSEPMRQFVSESRRRQVGRKRQEHLRWAAIGAVVAVLLAWLSVALFGRLFEEATVQRVSQPRQTQHQRAVDKLRAAREALLGDDPLRAAALARASAEVRATPQVRALWWRLRPATRRWRALKRPALLLARRPKTLIAVSSDGLWQLAPSGRVQQRSSSTIELGALSRDGTRLLTSAGNKLVEHDLTTAKTVKLGNVVNLRALAFVSMPVALAANGTLWAYRSSWRPLVRLPIRRATKSSTLDCHEQQRQLSCAVGTEDGRVLLWRRGREPRWLHSHDRPIRAVRFARSGNLLASADDGGTIYIWDTTTGVARALTGHQGEVSRLRFDSRGILLASAGADRTVRLWRVGRETTQVRAVLRVATPPTAIALVAADHGCDLFAATADGVITRWTTAAAPKRSHAGAVIALARAQQLVASAGADDTLRFWHHNGALRHVMSTSGRIAAISFVEDDKVLAAWRRSQNAAQLWRADPPWHRLEPRHPGPQRPTLAARKARDQTLATAKVGKRLLQIESSGTVVDQLAKGNHSLRLLPSDLSSAAITRDGGILTGHRSGAVRVWKISDHGSRLMLHRLWYGLLLPSERPSLISHQGLRLLRQSKEEASKPSGRWPRAVAQSWVAAGSPTGDILCLWRPNELQLWQPSSDRRLVAVPLTPPRQLIGIRGGCASASRDGSVRLHRPGRPAQQIAERADAISRAGESLLIAEGRTAYLQTDKTKRWSIDIGASVLALLDKERDQLLVGFADGSVTLYDSDAKRKLPPPDGSAAVTALLFFRGVLIVGHHDGTLAAWLLADSERLFIGRLHGTVTTLFLDGDQLHATTDLGDHHALDLSPFSGSHCAMLKRLWREIPVLWEGGGPVVRPEPSAHPCAGHQL